MGWGSEELPRIALRKGGELAETGDTRTFIVQKLAVSMTFLKAPF